MITVAASNSSDAKPSWSNFGKAKVHVAAPGDGIMSTVPGDKYSNMSGTSMATPLVAGLVAFLKAQDPTLTGAEIRALIQSTGAKVSIETACNCRIDAFQSVDTLLSKKPWMVPAAATLAKDATLQVSLKNATATAFESSNPAVLTVDSNGNVKAVANGTAKIKATFAGGTVESLDFNVGAAASNPGNPPSDPGNPGNPPGGDQCPIQDPQMCQILCQIMPNAAWCK
jgi:thermitase